MNEIQPDREPAARRTVTFMGNTYDLAALVAVITGAVLVFICLTCGLGGYCLPLVPIAAGIVGLASAARAQDPARTRLYSWLGIGAGGAAILLALVLFALYVGLILTGAKLGTQPPGLR